MSNITVCARFRPLSSKEKRDHGESICINRLNSESFVVKDDKEEEFTISFDKVFYEESEQADVYEFLVRPIVLDTFNAINGTIITYGQTGAGKTYSMEGTSIRDCQGQNKGLLPRVVDELFRCMDSADDMTKCNVKLSMVEIYMEKIRDLLDLSKDNIQIKEGKVQEIILSGATEVSVSDPSEALKHLSTGIANRAVGETQMNMSSSRSHCAYIFTVRQELKKERRVKTGKLILVDLAGSEKVEKTGAEGRLLEEAKTINKSLSALGNVINALTNHSPGKAIHIPYRDSKLTRMLQDALGGNSRTALLCCCSPSTSNASESLSTLRFGARARHIRTAPRVNSTKDKIDKKQLVPSPSKDYSSERILHKLRETMDEEQVKHLEEAFIMEGIFIDPETVKDLDPAYDDATSQTIALLQKSFEELECTINKLKKENEVLKGIVFAGEEYDSLKRNYGVTFYFGEYMAHVKHLCSWFMDSISLKKLVK
ncbi:serine/threonine-protein kinase KIN2 [Ranunculus cassubicifolius]